MDKTAKYRSIFITILILSIFLRLALALVNREANDDHLTAIQLVLDGHLPTMEKCRECFHPKLFYVTAAALLRILSHSTLSDQIISIQLLNFVAGVVTLIVIARFIWDYPVGEQALKSLSLALVVFNPKLIALHSQGTNDSFVILFGTLALYFAYYFIKQPSSKRFILIILFLLLAISTKVMGWIVFASILVAFLAAIPASEKKMTMTFYALILFVSVVLISALNPLSQMIVNYQKYGTPIANSRQKLPLPTVFHKTYKYKKYYFRPGIVSIQDGFLTFRFIDLLRYPLISNEPEEYSPQRTSFWTMLYADSNSLHFQNWPPSWQTADQENFNISRGIFILAVLPFILMFAGFIRELVDFFKALFHWRLFQTGNVLFLVNFCANIVFLMLTALLFRDFGFIKLAYILAGLLSFTWMLLRGLELVYIWSAQRFPTLRLLVSGWIILLCVFYVLDVLTLISQLYIVNG